MNKEAKVNLIDWLGFFNFAINPDTHDKNKSKIGICALLMTQIDTTSHNKLQYTINS